MGDPNQLERRDAAASSIRGKIGGGYGTALVLGTGLGPLAEEMEIDTAIPYGEIDGFPVSTAPGHRGRLCFGTLHGSKVVAMQGRFHLYEGWAPGDVTLPIYVLKALGVENLVVTNAAGGLNPDYRPGDAMLITDHLNFTGHDPLAGENFEELGPRFPDMSRAYCPELLGMAKQAADEAGVEIRQGIYCGVHGPSLETSAERRFFRSAGGDAVGMSTVCEVIAAAHAGLRVLGFSAIANAATGGPDQQPDTIEQILEYAGEAGKTIMQVLSKTVSKI